MLKQAIIYLVLSILVVIFAKYVHLIVVYIDTFFTFMSLKLVPVFSKANIGIIIHKVIVLVLLPVSIVAIPALAYRGFKGKQMPYSMEVIWLLWFIIVLSNIIIG